MDIFQFAFQTMYNDIDTLCGKVLDSHHDEFTQGNDKSEIICSNLLNDGSLLECHQRVVDLKLYHRRISLKILGQLINENEIKATIREIHEGSLQQLQLRSILTEKRFVQQKQLAERRLRELIFEIIGEYGKSNIRLTRRFDYLQISGRINVIHKVWKLRWERFCYRLCYDVMSESSQSSSKLKLLQYSILCPQKNSDETKFVIDLIKKSSEYSCSFSNAKVVSIIRIQRTKDLNITNVKLISTPIITDNTSDLINLIPALRAWIGVVRMRSPRAQPSPLGTISKKQQVANKNAPQAFELLSSSVIEWLHMSSYSPTSWDFLRRQLRKRPSVTSASSSLGQSSQDALDDFALCYCSQHSSFVSSPRLYFCIEERIMAGMGSIVGTDATGASRHASHTPASAATIASALLDYLQLVYNIGNRPPEETKGLSSVTDIQSLRRVLSESPLVVAQYFGRHRDISKFGGKAVQSDLLINFPDVVQVQCPDGHGLLHFAPALIYNLAETSFLKPRTRNADQLENGMKRCPHPILTMSSHSPNTSTLLDTLYCLVQPLSFPSLQLTNSTTSASLGLTDDTSASPIVNLLIPLSAVCMEELYRHYLWPNVSASIDVNTTTENPSTTAIPPILSQPPSFIHLLPDHARSRSLPSKLRHIYAYFTADYELPLEESLSTPTSPTLNPTSNSNPIGVGQRESEYGNDSQKGLSGSTTRQCFYLVQLWVDGRAQPDESVLESDLLEHQSIMIQKDDHLLRTMLSAHAKGIGWENSSGEDGTQGGPVKKKWDNAILSTLCRWRACLCESTDEPPPKYLCRYHSELKTFMDGRVNAKSPASAESASYLPQKPPILSGSVGHRDMVLIRAASTLLQELWEGKLKATVRSFTKKVCHDMVISNGARSRRGKASSSNFEQPSWAKWMDQEELKREFYRQSELLSRIDVLLNIERLVSSEYKLMMELCVFPSAELALIRKDMKTFRERDRDRDVTTEDEVAAVESETRLCEKKLSILRARRQEEQSARAAAQKKLAKLKALEESQARDPANFRNQRRF